jgi:hypothetical protein
MKKLFMMAALATALVFVGCETDDDDVLGNGENINGGGETASDTKKLKARNESSVTINGVKWNDETFKDGTNTTLAPGSTFTCVVSKDKAEDGTGFIYFNKADLSCRTQVIASFADNDTFVFTDNTVVIDMSDTTNTGTLVNIAKRMSTPTAPTLTAGSGRLTVSWTAVDLAVSYNIYHSTSSTASETPTQTNITTTSTVITGLTNDTPYYVWVQAVNTGGVSALSQRATETPRITIGDTGPGGGIIFFAEGGQYMECSGELGRSNWSTAVSVAASYSGGGFTDWHLPTKGELDLMYQNLKRNNLGGFSSEIYWSSTPQSSEGYYFSYAWYQSFSGGYQGTDEKSDTYSVRTIRSF